MSSYQYKKTTIPMKFLSWVQHTVPHPWQFCCYCGLFVHVAGHWKLTSAKNSRDRAKPISISEFADYLDVNLSICILVFWLGMRLSQSNHPSGSSDSSGQNEIEVIFVYQSNQAFSNIKGEILRVEFLFCKIITDLDNLHCLTNVCS